ncbi:MAG TPA: DUF3341 domain-containing protein [Steroidobacteraceae bacterium]|nr:DUF3341 domain-containing protein [Steroidobacteraceae bacterium]
MSPMPLYGVLAEFTSARELVAAARQMRRDEPRAHLEAYSPCALPELNGPLRTRRGHVAFWTLLGGLLGCVGTYALEWYSAAINYPLNIGGRPTASWPAFVPPALEMTLLGAAVFGVIAMIASAGLPRLHHPLFAHRSFERASADRFFLVLRGDAPGFEPQRARHLLHALRPLAVTEVRG